MIYADFSYYKDTFCGEMAEGDFKRLSRSAAAYLDSVTFDRIPSVTDEKIMEKVRAACCAVADVLLQKEQRDGIAKRMTAFLLPTQPKAVRTNNGFTARRCCISAIRSCCIGGWNDACVYGNDYAYPAAV